MSCIVYQTDKRTGIKYAYESVSYWDKEKGQPRSKRKYIGKVDPETGEIIPTDGSRKRGRKSSETGDEKTNLIRLHEELKAKDQTIKEIQKELKSERKKNERLVEVLLKIRGLAGDALDV